MGLRSRADRLRQGLVGNQFARHCLANPQSGVGEGDLPVVLVVAPADSAEGGFGSHSTIQGRYLFTPSQRFNDIALGVFGRAQRMHPIRICEIEVVSGHFHILFDVDSVQQVSDFTVGGQSAVRRPRNRRTADEGPQLSGAGRNRVAERIEAAALRLRLAEGVKRAPFFLPENRDVAPE